MSRSLTVFFAFATWTLSLQLNAETIIKLGFSTDSLADIELINGELSTVVDDVGATTGDQNTEVTFLGPLGGQAAIQGDNASFTIEGVQMNGMPVMIGKSVLQATKSGTFRLHDPSNNLLLEGTFGEGTLSGPVGSTSTGGFLTTEFGSFTGGDLLPLLEVEGLTQSSVSISLTDVNNGAGLALDSDGKVADFQADATANVGAQRPPDVPEPASAVLLASSVLASVIVFRRRR